MIHKIQSVIEPCFVLIAISFQPILGAISAVAASIYYISVLKINVVDKKYGGSWKAFVKSIFK